MNKIFDRSENEITEILPLYLTDLAKSRALDQKSFNKGLSKFLNAVPSIAADIPKLPDWLSEAMMTLYESNAINFRDVTWYDKKKSGEDDEPPMVEDYYRIIAQFLKLLTCQEGSTPASLVKFYR